MAQQRNGGNRRGRGGGRDDGGEALRGLVGAGPSKVGISAAMRARDISRPSDEERAAAESAPLPRVGPPVTTQARPQAGAPTPHPPGSGGTEPSSS